MDDILLSIIVPVYDVEKYLAECIESIINSGFDNRCELILVDDGSTDQSGSICDEYAMSNILSIHKENGGLSSARNVGIKEASGKYIAFIDSDDYVAPKSIMCILNELEKNGDTDLYFMQGNKVYPDGKQIALGDNISSSDIKKSKCEMLYYLSIQNKFAGSACTKLYRRTFLEKYAICFPDDRRYGEDLIFVLKCIFYAETYQALDFSFYRYRQRRAGSITSTLSSKSYFDTFLFIDEAVTFLTHEHHSINAEAEMCMSFVVYEYILQVWHYAHINAESKNKAKELLDQYRWVMKFATSSRSKIIRSILNVFGYGLTAQILSLAKTVLG